MCLGLASGYRSNYRENYKDKDNCRGNISVMSNDLQVKTMVEENIGKQKIKFSATLEDYNINRLKWKNKNRNNYKRVNQENRLTEYPEKRTETKMEYNFKVGDKVITSMGQTGVIESICDCKYCKERGFCEPQVKTINGVDKIYITDNDKRLDFKSFYQIGDYLFGNIDKESVEYDIKNEACKIEEATNNMYTYKRQLKRLNIIEALGVKF